MLYGIREQIYILNESGYEEEVNVYLHPREMQLLWENKYHEIPEIHLYTMKKAFMYMLKNPKNEDFESFKDATNTKFKNLYTFYHTWNITEYSKRIEEAKKLLKNLPSLF